MPVRIRAGFQSEYRNWQTRMYNRFEALRPQILAAAWQMSDGPRSLEQLRQQDHPYATRHTMAEGFEGLSRSEYSQIAAFGAPGTAGGLINRQDGAFQAGWVWDVSRYSDSIRGTLSNHATTRDGWPLADLLLEGTETMIGCPTLSAILYRVSPFLSRYVEDIQRDWNGVFHE